MDTNDQKPTLKAVDNVTTLEQPLSTADAAIAEFNDPTNMANTIAQAAIDASFARIRYDAFVAVGFTAEEALLLVTEGYGGYRD